MALPKASDTQTLNFAYDGVPFAYVESKAAQLSGSLDFAYNGVPFFAATGPVVSGVVALGMSISETETHTIALGRTRRLPLSTIAETETLSFTLNEAITLPKALKVSTLNFAYDGVPFAYIESNARQETLSLNFAYDGVPFVAAKANSNGIVSLALSLAESLNHTAALRRTRRIVSTIANTEAHTAAFDRARRVNSTIPNTFSIQNPLSRTRRVSTAWANSTAHSMAVRRAVPVSSAVDEAINNSIAANALRPLSLFDSYLQEPAIKVDRQRWNSFTAADTETLNYSIQRALSLVGTVPQTQTLSLGIDRFLEAAIALAQVIELDIDWQPNNLVRFDFTVAQANEHSFGEFRRIREISKFVDEILTHDLLLGRTKLIGSTLQDIEAINLVLNRSRALAANLAELEQVTASLSRRKDIAATINQIESVAINGTRLKLMSFIVQQTQTHADYYLARVKRMNLSVGEFEQHQANFNRARAFIALNDQQQVVGVNVARLREQVIAIAETQGVDAALARLRTLIESIELYSDYTFDVDAVILGDIKYKVDIAWTSWNVVSSNFEGAVIAQTTEQSECFYIEEKRRTFKF